MAGQRTGLFVPSLLVFLALLAPCLASMRSHNQFQAFFPTFEGWHREEIELSCGRQMAEYRNTSIPDPPNMGHQLAWSLTDCILRLMSEVEKLETSVSGILLGLLPAALSQIGPSQAQTALLSARRPVLSLLLYVGTPAPDPSGGNIYAEPISYLKSYDEYALLSRFLVWTRGRRGASRIYVAALSIVQYLAAFTAAGNCAYQIYRLTYNAVSLAPIVVLLRGVAESAVIFGWLLLLVPMHLLSMWVFRLSYSMPKPRRSWTTFIADELRPCCSGTPIDPIPRQSNVLQVVLYLVLTLGACLHIMAGTVLLGSVMFITLADVLVVVECFVGTALLSRVIVMIELRGMQVAYASEKGSSSSSLYQGTHLREKGSSKHENSREVTALVSSDGRS